MKQCVRCDREYPDSKRFCEIDGAYLINDVVEDFIRISDTEVVCSSCDGLSPGIDMDGCTIMHCPVCGDADRLTLEDAKAWVERVSNLRTGEAQCRKQ
jgi:hypothetical protein